MDYLTHWRAYVDAARLQRGNVEVFRGVFTPREDQPVVRRDGPPPGIADYRIDIPRDGEYQISLLYASAEPRPLRLILDGREAVHSLCAQSTGGWNLDNQKWEVAGSFHLTGGARALTLVSDGAFPVLRMIRLVRSE